MSRDVEIDGWLVQLFRGADGVMTVAVYTEKADKIADHHENGSPKMRLVVNEHVQIVNEAGELVEDDPRDDPDAMVDWAKTTEIDVDN